jgi:hypothetical protein
MLISFFSCFSIYVPWGSSTPKIEADLTVRHPEKFAKGALIPQYLKSTQKHLEAILNDKDFEKESIRKQVNARRYQRLVAKVDHELTTLANLQDRLNMISRSLRYASGADYYRAIKTQYFKQIRDLKNKDSDPFNIIKIDDIDNNRDCLYRFLAWIWPQSISTHALRNLSPTEILKNIDQLKQIAFGKGLTETHNFVRLIREIGAFFNDELAKYEYDSFVDGQEALSKLIIENETARQKLREQISTIMQLWSEAKIKVLDTKNFLETFRVAADQR